MRHSNILSNPYTQPVSLTTWLRFNIVFIIAAVWLSNLLFGLYILSFYLGQAIAGNSMRWNQKLPDLFDPHHAVSTHGMLLHFIAGAIILMLGSIQLLSAVRLRYPRLHRFIGKVYLLAALLTATGGLLFIFIKGTVGGLVMDIGFGGYGALMILCAICAYHYAKRRDFVAHRRWAIRLFALAIGSWLYRMDYGFWIFFTDGLGHARDFHGYFDKFMAFFFYLPNLYIADKIAALNKKQSSIYAQALYGSLLACTSIFVVLGTYTFLTDHWWAAIYEFITLAVYN